MMIKIKPNRFFTKSPTLSLLGLVISSCLPHKNKVAFFEIELLQTITNPAIRFPSTCNKSAKGLNDNVMSGSPIGPYQITDIQSAWHLLFFRWGSVRSTAKKCEVPSSIYEFASWRRPRDWPTRIQNTITSVDLNINDDKNKTQVVFYQITDFQSA